MGLGGMQGRQNQEEYEQVHYSKLQLFIGNRELPPLANSDQPRSVPYVSLSHFVMIPS